MPVSLLTVWWDRDASGGVNMAADELLAAESGIRNACLVRLYGWDRPTVSLGVFQPLAAARSSEAVAALPLVRRPSGGGAILHGSDLTYAAAIPRSHPWGRTPQRFYDAMHGGLVSALQRRGVPARLHLPELRASPTTDAAFLCFDRRAAGDVVTSNPEGPSSANDPKIMGSAQRRLAGTVLQHGTLLVRRNLAVPAAISHHGLADLHGEGVVADLESLVVEWLGNVATAAGAALSRESEGFTTGREAEIAALRGRFVDETWIGRR